MSYLTIYNNKDNNVIEDPAMNFKFPLDLFQNEACYRISKDENVFVTAHTGCGKTVVALYGIAHTLKKGQKVIYTSPTKSLSNQKYEEFAKQFPNVGILTGDIKMNPDADCIIMTTEILLNMLFNFQDSGEDNAICQNSVDINDIGCVIFDEVHYINDPDRGKVWEETLVLLPSRVNLVLLSATIDKADRMAEWLGNIKQKPIHLITTLKRVVPLRHYFWDESRNDLLEIIDANGNFYNYNLVKQSYEKKKYSSIINSFVLYLQKRKMLPAIYFKFSRAKCEKCAREIVHSFVTQEERKEIDLVFRNRLSKYKQYYGHMQQYQDVYNQLLKGVVYHHSGLIPILKEIIEILYAKGLIKLLFATETFAVGVNMPAKTVIFNDLQKYDNKGLRYLRTDEYLQMSGRAGRRGLDKHGTVIILPTMDLPDYSTLKSVMTGNSPVVKSKFVPSYQFVLKALHNSDLSIEKFINTTLFCKENDSAIGRLEATMGKIDYGEYEKLSEKMIADIREYMKLDTKLANNIIKLSNKDRKKAMKRRKAIERVEGFKESFAIIKKVVDAENEQKDVKAQIEYYKNHVLDDVKCVVDILRRGKYIDEDDKLTERGLIAIEINNCNPLVFTEMLFSRSLEECTFEEIVGVVAAFIDEKSLSNHEVSPKGLSGSISEKVIDNLYSLQDEYEYLKGVESEYSFNIPQKRELNYEVKLDFVVPAYLWAKGFSVNNVYQCTDIYEGNFVKGILRITSILEDIVSIAESLGYHKLLKVLEGYEDKLIRDVVTVNSLYIVGR